MSDHLLLKDERCHVSQTISGTASTGTLGKLLRDGLSVYGFLRALIYHLELPGLRYHLELPALKYHLELPALKYHLELPALRYHLELPAF